MEIKKQSSLAFDGVDIINVHFDSFRPIEPEQEISINIDAKLIHEEQSLMFKILMLTTVDCKEYFVLNVQALGTFRLSTLDSSVPASSFINKNAPAIMFPYVRAFITSFSASCGASIPSIVLPPQFFNGELERLEMEE